MTTVNSEWLSVPEIAEILGVAQRDVRNMIADRKLIAVRRGPGGALCVSPLVLVEKNGTVGVLPSLRGTLTALADAGCDDEEAWSWLTTEEPELRARPIDALRSGRIHAVRRVASMLAF